MAQRGVSNQHCPAADIEKGFDQEVRVQRRCTEGPDKGGVCSIHYRLHASQVCCEVCLLFSTPAKADEGYQERREVVCQGRNLLLGVLSPPHTPHRVLENCGHLFITMQYIVHVYMLKPSKSNFALSFASEKVSQIMCCKHNYLYINL